MLGVSDVVAMVFPRERCSEEERKFGVKSGVSGGQAGLGWERAGYEAGIRTEVRGRLGWLWQGEVGWGRQWGVGLELAMELLLRPGGVSDSGLDLIPALPFCSSQGSQASQDEITASAYQAVILDQKYNNEPVQIRVPMGKEPPHLMSIFKGQMVVYQVWLLD